MKLNLGGGMAGAFRSIFKPAEKQKLDLPGGDKPVMRVLEPRILLDAAAVETAIDIAGKAAHDKLADDYLAGSKSSTEGNNTAADPGGNETPTRYADIAGSEDSTDSAAPRSDREIVFIDAAVDDKIALIASLEPTAVVHVLDAAGDGVRQIADVLEKGGPYDAVHIFSHGESAALKLGDTVLDAGSIAGRHAAALATIGDALSAEADILLYGCNFGSGEAGKRAAGLLAASTGADIAASDDLTGSESLAGDWDLELHAGHIQTQAYTLPDWEGILDGFTFEATASPDYSHANGGVVGTPGTIATWSNAVTYDPGGVGPPETYDLRATIVGASEHASATFENVSVSDGSGDDFRVVVTNIGPYETTIAGEDVLEEGSVTVLWEFLIPGTDQAAPTGAFDITLSDIDGLAGMPDTREAISIVSDEMWSYTTQQELDGFGDQTRDTDLEFSVDQGEFRADGTEQGNDDPFSALSAHWADSNQFIVTYHSRTGIAQFDLDGDGGVTFSEPNVRPTQSLDLDGDAPGVDYYATYINGSDSGSSIDVPLSIADADLAIFDLDNAELDSATITLSNGQSGDELRFDSSFLLSMGIDADLVISPNPPFGTLHTLTLTGPSLVSNFDAAIRSVKFANDLADGSLDKLTVREVQVDISDGIISTTGATTYITIEDATAAPSAGANIYVADEDNSINESVATGLLSDDEDPNDATLTITAAELPDGSAIPIGSAFTMPSGAQLTLFATGAFDYVPAAHYSGSETIGYTVSNGSSSSQSFATFNIQPVVDPVSITFTQSDSNSDEDQPTNPIQIAYGSLDPSETQLALIENIPDGVIITDGVNEFQSLDGVDFVEINDWNLSNIYALPLQNSDRDITVTLSVENEEIDGGFSFDSVDVTFEIDAVADTPTLIVLQAAGGVDADVSLIGIISPQLFDVDGSEQITDITISNIPAGGQIFVNSVSRPVVGGAVSLQMTDLTDIFFRPPATGNPIVYNMEVSATATETNPETPGGVSVASATQAGIGLVVTLNDDDDPVIAVQDFASTFTGESVNINVLNNDYFPDGGPLVTKINGDLIDLTTPVTLAGGEGRVLLGPSGGIIFEASTSFSGQVVFNYTFQDIDGDESTANVTVNVQPRWVIGGQPTAVEGGQADVTVTLQGAIPQGATVSTDIGLLYGTANAADVGSLADAINNAVALPGHEGFSFSGDTLTYTAPTQNYTVAYDPAANLFADISGSGTGLNIANNGVVSASTGFNFEFYGDTFSDLFISADGYITFGSPTIEPNNQALDGYALVGRPIIAPFWDDLGAAGAADVYVETAGPPGERTYTVQWNLVTNEAGGAGTAQFQVILYEANGDIRFNYEDVTFGGPGDEGAGASIGLQSRDTVADQHGFNQPGSVVAQSSILFTRNVALNPSLNILLDIVDDPTFENAEDFEVLLYNPTSSAIGTDRTNVEIATSDNQSPNAIDDSATVSETSAVSINVLTAGSTPDNDPEGQSLTLTALNGTPILAANTVVTLASGATVSASPDGTVLYHPNTSFAYLGTGDTANDSFVYTIDDGSGGTDTATVNVTINGVNQQAYIDLNDDGTTPDRDNAFMFQPTDGPLPIAASTASIIDPDDNSFVSLRLDLDDFQQPGNEIIDVNGVQIVFGTASSGTTTITGTPPGNDTIFHVDYAIISGSPDAHVITITQDGGGEMNGANLETLVRAITYDDNSSDDIPGIRTITFSLEDGEGILLRSQTEITVVGNNIAPDAVDDGTGTPFTTQEEMQLRIDPATLLANDSDPEGDPIQIVSVDGGLNGVASIDVTGDVLWTPNADFTGSATFTYTISDGRGDTDTAVIHVDVTPVNDAPRIDLDGSTAGQDYAYTYTENDPYTQLIAGDGFVIDVDNAQLTSLTIVLTNGEVDDIVGVGVLPPGISQLVTPVEAATGLTAPGTIVVQLTGSATPAEYETALRAIAFRNSSDTPVAGDRIFTVVASDGAANSTTATLTVTVVPVNDLPDTGTDGPFDVDEDDSITILRSTLLGNDSDADGDTVSLVSVQDGTNGTVALDGSGNIVFTPTANYNGAASFTYTADDGNGGQTVGTVIVNVVSVNDIAVLDLDANTGGDDYTTNYIENAAGISIVDASVSIADVDHTTLDQATIRLTNGQIGDIIEVGTLSGGITASIVPSGAVTSADTTVTVTLSGSADISDYLAALQSVTFRSNSDAPSVVDRVFSVVVDDGLDESNYATSIITITAVNDTPTAIADSYNIFEDTPRTFSAAELLGNDIDPDFDTLFITSVQNPVNGTAILNGDGTVTFTPAADYSGPASFEYTMDDGSGSFSSTTVSLLVQAVNDAPVLDLDSVAPGTGFAATHVEGGSAVAVIGADIAITDIDSTQLQGASITITNGQIGDLLEVGTMPGGIVSSLTPSVALTVPGPMTLTLTGAATLADYQTALQAVTYRTVSDAPTTIVRAIDVSVFDGQDNSNIAVSNVSVTATNDDPVATNDGVLTTNEDTPLSISASSLLSNDSDPDEETFALVSVQSAVNGTVSLSGSTVTFTPDADYSGPASFTYTIDDSNGGTSTAQVDILVSSVNDAPTIDLDGGTAGSGNVSAYLENDPGTALVDASAVISDVDHVNLLSATFVLTNGQIGDVLEAGLLPGGLVASTMPSAPLTTPGSITLTIAGSATQADYLSAIQTVTFRSVSDDPDTSNRSITVDVNDGEDSSSTAISLVMVTAVNDAPVGSADGTFTFDEDTTLTIPVASLLVNDSDAEDPTLTIVSVQSAVNGTVSLGSGIVSFTPDPAHFGPASFTYTVVDSGGLTDTVIVNLSVTSVNDPTVVDLSSSAPGDGYSATYTENDPGISIVGADVSLFDEDHLSLASASVVLTNGRVGDVLELGLLPPGMSAIINPPSGLTSPGTITVTLAGSLPLADYETALQTVTYRNTGEEPDVVQRRIEISVNDGEDSSNVAVSRIDVISVNDAPVALADGVPTPISVIEDTPYSFNPVSSNDFDVENDALAIVEIDGNPIIPGGSVSLANGSISLNMDGQTLTFAPSADYFGPVVFAYTLSDGALTDTATVSLNVVAVNDAPVALDDGPVVLIEDGFAVFDPVTANDSDVEGDTLTITAINGQSISAGGTVSTANGRIDLAGDGRTLTFVPSTNFFGTSQITYTLSDGQAADDAVVTFEVTSIDDPITVGSTPPDLTISDGETVNLALASYFNDPDGDAVVYSASGLPAGLSIDPTTGIVIGTVDRSASQGSPYTVTLSADDGVASIATTSFTISVVNTVPVAAPPLTVTVDDGSTLSVDVNGLFSDADEDPLQFTVSGLPVWASFNAVTGILTGTAPSDASVFGPTTVTVIADDQEGGISTIDILIDPQNVAPVAIFVPRDITVAEDDPVDIDLNGIFIDGGSDTDPVNVTVSGLPEGVTYDPVTMKISGTTASGTTSSNPYAITVTADDGQGGLSSLTFRIRVANNDFIADEPSDLFDEELFEDESDDFETDSGSTFILDGTDDLNGVASINLNEDAIRSVVNSVDPLNGITPGNVNGVNDQVAALKALAEGGTWESVSGWISEGFQSSPYAPGNVADSGQDDDKRKFNEATAPETIGSDAPENRLAERLSFDTIRRNGIVYIELNNTLHAELDGKLVKLVITGPNGEKLPEWVRTVRLGFMTAQPPAGEKTLDISMLATLDNGLTIERQLSLKLDAEEKTVEPVAKAAP